MRRKKVGSRPDPKGRPKAQLLETSRVRVLRVV